MSSRPMSGGDVPPLEEHERGRHRERHVQGEREPTGEHAAG